MEQIWHLLGGLGPFQPLGDWTHEIELVADLMKRTLSTADLVGRSLAGDQQDRRVGCISRGHCGGGVIGTRTGDHKCHSYLSGGSSIPVRRKHGSLLVATGHKLHFRGVVEPIVDIHDLKAGNGEHRLHACGDQLPVRPRDHPSLWSSRLISRPDYCMHLRIAWLSPLGHDARRALRRGAHGRASSSCAAMRNMVASSP